MDHADIPSQRSLRPLLLRIAVALLFFGVLSEFVILSQLYRVSREQAAIEAKKEAEIARHRGRVPVGGKLVQEPDGTFTISSAPKTVAPGVTAVESYRKLNINVRGRGVLEHGELETTRLLLTPIAIAIAIPTVAGLILTVVLAKSSGPSTAPPTEPPTV
jgi:hypothetical protein